VVVDLAVQQHAVAGFGVGEGLVTRRGRVQDRKSRGSQDDVRMGGWERRDALVVRSAVNEAGDHALNGSQQRFCVRPAVAAGDAR
jgi:hypothetical protein